VGSLSAFAGCLGTIGELKVSFLWLAAESRRQLKNTVPTKAKESGKVKTETDPGGVQRRADKW